MTPPHFPLVGGPARQVAAGVGQRAREAQPKLDARGWESNRQAPLGPSEGRTYEAAATIGDRLREALSAEGSGEPADPRLSAAADIANVVRSGLEEGGGGKLLTIDGRRPLNYEYAARTFHPTDERAREIAPDGVRYKENGTPDFSPWASQEVEIELSDVPGDRATDVRRANEAAGLERTPRGYTWNHVEDGRTMQLVPSDLHRAVPHVGGRAVHDARILGKTVTGV